MHSRTRTGFDCRVGLEPHPEAGFFREIRRSASQVRPHDTRSDAQLERDDLLDRLADRVGIALI